MIWDTDIPEDTLQAYVDVDEGIHSYIQDTKVAVSDRMKCNNGTFDEHKVCQAGEDGSHIPTETAFVYISTWDLRLEIIEGAAQKPGTLHYITAPVDRKGLYVINNSNIMERAAVLDHSLLTGLLESFAHADLLLTNAGNGMAVDLHLIDDGEMNITEYGVDAGSPVEPAHVDLSWYDAHGADSIDARHIPDDHLTVGDDRINASQKTTGWAYNPPAFVDGLDLLYGWPKFRLGTNPDSLEHEVIAVHRDGAVGDSARFTTHFGYTVFMMWYGEFLEANVI